MAKDKRVVVKAENKAVINTRPVQDYLTSGEAINIQLQGEAPRQEVVVFDDLERAIVKDHNGLTSIGLKSHAEIDDHLDDKSNPHQLTPEQVGAARTVHLHSTADLTDYPDTFPPVPHGHDDAYHPIVDFIDSAVGASDAGKPIKLNGSGQIDNSMIDLTTFNPVDSFDPSNGVEYPDVMGKGPGSFWIMKVFSNPTGVTPEPFYTFTTGALVGKDVTINDVMLITEAGWVIRSGTEYTGYYPLDGSMPITKPFAGGNQQIKNIADGSDMYDAATVRQLTILDNGKAEAFHSHVINEVDGLGPILDETVRSKQQSGVGSIVENFIVMSKAEYALITPTPGVVYGLKD